MPFPCQQTNVLKTIHILRLAVNNPKECSITELNIFIPLCNCLMYLPLCKLCLHDRENHYK